MLPLREFCHMVGAEPPPGLAADQDLVSWPNAISLSGYAAGLAWLAGGPASLAIWSIVADELDGVSARNLQQTSPIGDRLDHSIDICLLALTGVKLGLGWIVLPLSLFASVIFKEMGLAPPFGSHRAGLMAYALFI